jgi:hypothetical protein
MSGQITFCPFRGGTVSQFPQNEPVKGNEAPRKNLIALFHEGVTTSLGKAKDLAIKPIYHTTGWINYFMGDKTPAEVNALGAATRSTKNWMGLPELPGKVYYFFVSVIQGRPVQAFFNGAEIVNPAYDVTTELVKEGIVNASKETMVKFSLANFYALLIGQSKQAYESITKLVQDKLTAGQQFLLGLGLGKNFSYCALAVTGIALGGHSTFALFVYSTSALIFANAHFYFDGLVQPNKTAELKQA